MAEWLVKLEGYEFDLAELSRQLTSPELSLSKEDDAYWLRSACFVALTEVSHVLTEAEKQLKHINGAARVFKANYEPVKLGSVRRQNDNGTRDHFVFLTASIKARSDLSATVTVSGGTPQPVQAASKDINAATTQANQDEVVQRALRIYGSREHDWVNLYRVFEIVQEEVGNITARGWATKGEIDSFKHTANSVGAVGDEARHGVQHTQPPKSPMDLEEAQSLIRTVMRSWLNSKRPSP